MITDPLLVGLCGVVASFPAEAGRRRLFDRVDHYIVSHRSCSGRARVWSALPTG